MPMINCKTHLELNWTKNCVMSDKNGETTFKITNRKLYDLFIGMSIKQK